MSGDAIRAWRKQVTREMLVQACLTVEEKRRPSTRALSLVGYYLAVSLKDSKGFTDETEEQIATGLHDVYAIETVGNALYALREIWVPIRRGAKGSGTRRVFTLHDPKQLLNDHKPQRDYPAEIQANKNGKNMTPQRETNATERDYPVVPEHYLNTAPPAPALAGLYSPENDELPTPTCVECAAVEIDPAQVRRLVRAVHTRCDLGKGKVRESAENKIGAAAGVMLRHFPGDQDREHVDWIISVLHTWSAVYLRQPLSAGGWHDALLAHAGENHTRKETQP